MERRQFLGSMSSVTVGALAMGAALNFSATDRFSTTASGAAQPQLVRASKENDTVTNATDVLNEIMKIPASSIPERLFTEAFGLVVVPGMLKLGFIGSFQRGKGVLIIRDATTGQWRPPVFVTLTGAGAGFQAGVQSMDIILVLRTQKSVNAIISKDRHLTLGVDAAAAAGPVGRQASLATDIQMKSEILSYSRTRGLFAGAAIDGTVVDIDVAAGQSYYTTATTSNEIPATAKRLLETIQKYSGNAMGLETVRQSLATAANQLQPLLDDQWKTFLALPAEVYTSGGVHPPLTTMQTVQANFAKVASDPQYRNLTERQEFVTVRTLINQYTTLLEQTASAASGVSPNASNVMQPGPVVPPPPTTQVEATGTVTGSVPASNVPATNISANGSVTGTAPALDGLQAPIPQEPAFPNPNP